MFITLTDDHVEFKYGSKHWKCHFSEIVELSIQKKNKSYFFENTAIIACTIIGYYFAVFSDFLESYYIFPATVFYILLLMKRFYNANEFEYYLILKDIYGKGSSTKINHKDLSIMSQQIERYIRLNHDRLTKKNQGLSSIPDTMF